MTRVSRVVKPIKTSKLAQDIIWQGRPSIVLAYPKLSWFFLATFLLIWLLLAGKEITLLIKIAYSLFAIPSLLLFSAEVIKLKATIYTLTRSRLLVKSGILKRITDELELFRVRDFRLEEPIALMPFRLGNLILVTSDRTTPVITLKAIPELKKLHEVLRESVMQCWNIRGVREIDAG